MMVITITGETLEIKNYYKKGTHYMGTCPFHPDNNKSLFVDPANNSYHYWDCNKAGKALIEVVE